MKTNPKWQRAKIREQLDWEVWDKSVHYGFQLGQYVWVRYGPPILRKTIHPATGQLMPPRMTYESTQKMEHGGAVLLDAEAIELLPEFSFADDPDHEVRQ